MKKIEFLFGALIATLLLLSCGSDSKKLLGKWVFIEEDVRGDTEKFDVKDEVWVLFFKKDGTGVFRQKGEDELMEWTYKDGFLTVTIEEEVASWTVKELTSSTLTLLENDGISYTFTKIKNEQYEEPKNDGSTVVSDKEDSKWKYSEETKIDPMDNTSSKLILASLISDNSVTFDPWGNFSFTLAIRSLNGKPDVLLFGNNNASYSFTSLFGGMFDDEKTYRVKFDDEAAVNVNVQVSSNGKTVFFGPPEKLISELKTTDKLTIEAEFASDSKKIITFSTKGLKWEENEQEPSNPLLSKYKLTWGASIQTVQNAFAKVWSYNGEPTNSLWEPAKEGIEGLEEYTAIGVRVFSVVGDGDDCFYFYQDKLYKISAYDYTDDIDGEEIIDFDPNIEKQVRALQTKK